MNIYQTPKTFAQWQAFARAVHAAADRITNARHDAGWRLAATVGIPRDMCCLHNASIDENFTGWCAGADGYNRLKVAKRANHIVNDWTASRLADRIVGRAWQSMQRSERSAA